MFKLYLYEREFEAIINHKVLKCLLTMKEPRSKLARWILELSEYSMEIIDRPEKENSNVETLSKSR